MTLLPQATVDEFIATALNTSYDQRHTLAAIKKAFTLEEAPQLLRQVVLTGLPSYATSTTRSRFYNSVAKLGKYINEEHYGITEHHGTQQAASIWKLARLRTEAASSSATATTGPGYLPTRANADSRLHNYYSLNQCIAAYKALAIREAGWPASAEEVLWGFGQQYRATWERIKESLECVIKGYNEWRAHNAPQPRRTRAVKITPATLQGVMDWLSAQPQTMREPIMQALMLGVCPLNKTPQELRRAVRRANRLPQWPQDKTVHSVESVL